MKMFCLKLYDILFSRYGQQPFLFEHITSQQAHIYVIVLIKYLKVLVCLLRITWLNFVALYLNNYKILYFILKCYTWIRNKTIPLSFPPTFLIFCYSCASLSSRRNRGLSEGLTVFWRQQTVWRPMAKSCRLTWLKKHYSDVPMSCKNHRIESLFIKPYSLKHNIVRTKTKIQNILIVCE